MTQYIKLVQRGESCPHCAANSNNRQGRPASVVELALRGAASAGLLDEFNIIGFVQWANAECALTFSTKSNEIALFGMGLDGQPKRLEVSHWKAVFARW